jgi:hypothetical protein
MNSEDEEATVSVTRAHEMSGKSQISRGAFYAAIRRGDVPQPEIRDSNSHTSGVDRPPVERQMIANRKAPRRQHQRTRNAEVGHGARDI